MKKLFPITLLLSLCLPAFAQRVSYKIVDNDLDAMKNLQIKTFAEFYIPPVHANKLPANLCVEAAYWLPKGLDVRGGIKIGATTGLTVGGTLHFIDRIKERNQKFILSQSTSGRTTTTRYIKVPVNVKSISGPCADFFAGLMNKRFTTRLEAGWHWQTFRKSAIEVDGARINDGTNGNFSFKVQGVFQAPIYVEKSELKTNTGQYQGGITYYEDQSFNAVGMGWQVDMTAVMRPWKKMTMYAGGTLGYIKVLKDAGYPILSLRIGLSLNYNANLFKSKK